jgi:hypothetical protein
MQRTATASFIVIARLGRAIQYAVPFQFHSRHLWLLDAALSRGMTEKGIR